jgi:transcriptional antiterminator NusG
MSDVEIPPFCAQPKWFAVQVAARHEKKVALMLEGKGCLHFLPTYKSKRRWTDRAKLIEQPLFPGYVFCQITRPLARHVLGTSGVRRIVTFGGRPYPLSDEEILVLRQVVSSGEDVQPSQYLAIGERVKITSGPFAGISGFLTHFKNQQRLVISVDLIQKSVSIEVEISSVAASPRYKSGFGKGSSISAGLG